MSLTKVPKVEVRELRKVVIKVKYVVRKRGGEDCVYKDIINLIERQLEKLIKLSETRRLLKQVER